MDKNLILAISFGFKLNSNLNNKNNLLAYIARISIFMFWAV